MNKDPKIAYIIVCWNNRDIIDECLQAIKSQSHKSNDIYLIDNASKDGTAQHVEQNYPEVHLVKSDKNNGFARGNNMLISRVLKDKDVKYFALINSDAVLDVDWTKNLVDYLATKNNVACAQGITLDFYNHSIIDSEHIFINNNFQATQYGYTKIFEEAFSYPRKVFGVNAAAAIYSRDFIESQPNHRLFDEKFYMYLEDADVAFRSIVAGWNNYYVPSARAYHMGSVSSKKRSSGYNIYMTMRNQPALLFKSMSVANFLTFLPTAVRFEAQLYKSLSSIYGKKIIFTSIKARLIGTLRLSLFIGDRLRIRTSARRSSREIARLLRSNGIF